MTYVYQGAQQTSVLNWIKNKRTYIFRNSIKDMPKDTQVILADEIDFTKPQYLLLNLMVKKGMPDIVICTQTPLDLIPNAIFSLAIFIK